MLLMAQSERQLQSHVEITSGLLLHLGFILNSRKCLTDPKQTMEFLGFIVDSEQMTLSLPSAKVCKIRKECFHVRNQSLVSARQANWPSHFLSTSNRASPSSLQSPTEAKEPGSFTRRPLLQPKDHPV